ncbi:FtsX-like permease family protein [Hymenobacter sp. BT730]|uniref:FtsX-like permease family protein n=1 Tax=Hymenobacter sp. BT730 TaxID=3063332 RepID=UPI0026E091F7|nr:FtsX-like permease family protein [Hymenobacter sp. BT730]
MIRHLFTLIWNRKRSNFLLIAEIVLSFFVVFVVGSLLLYNLNNYSQPLGYNYENVWEMSLDPGPDTVARREKIQMLMQRIKSLPGVVGVTRSSVNTPFAFSTMNTNVQYNGKQSPTSDFYKVDDEFGKLMNLNVTEGRWFDQRDNAAQRIPVVINQAFKDAVFPTEKPLGKILTEEKGTRQWQVVGVVETYRAGSDFSENAPAYFERRLDDTVRTMAGYDLPWLLIKVQPGQGAILEQKLVKEVLGVTKSWSVKTNTLEQNRISKLKVVLTPIVVLGIVCVFLILNVALGLFGVLWYNINQRRSEIGLRRALGATGLGIGGQFIGEMLVVTTLGVLVGVVLAVQFPLLGVFGVAPAVYGAAIAVAALLIYLLTAICAFHPSRLAAGIQPAVALREE